LRAGDIIIKNAADQKGGNKKERQFGRAEEGLDFFKKSIGVSLKKKKEKNKRFNGVACLLYGST
jgi:hypothetical protein